MAAPGRYRHFKGGEYRALLTIAWGDRASVKDADHVGVYTTGDLSYDTPLIVLAVADSRDEDFVLAATWCGGAPGARGDMIVIYTSLDGVFARTEREFIEEVDYGAPEMGLTRPRFERIGP